MVTLALLVTSSHTWPMAWEASSFLTMFHGKQSPWHNALLVYVCDKWLVDLCSAYFWKSSLSWRPWFLSYKKLKTLQLLGYLPVLVTYVVPCWLCTALTNEYSSVITGANLAGVKKYDSISIVRLTASTKFLEWHCFTPTANCWLCICDRYWLRANISFASTWRVGKAHSTKILMHQQNFPTFLMIPSSCCETL